MPKLTTQPTTFRKCLLFARDLWRMKETKVLLLIVAAAVIVLVAFASVGCQAVSATDNCDPYLPLQGEVRQFNAVAGPVVESVKPFLPSPFRELVEVVGGGLLAYGGYKRRDVKAAREHQQAVNAQQDLWRELQNTKEATTEIVKGWQDVLDAGGVTLGQKLETDYGPMTVAEILADAQGPLAAKLVDEAQGKA